MRLIVVLVTVVASLAGGSPVSAQGRRGAPPGQAPSPRASAVFDITGSWVSVVTEDWRYRMMTPPKGDYSSVPMTPAARRIADTWDVSKDGSCLAYGAAGLMRLPTRLRISWESDTVLKVETDAGQQTRRFMFEQGQQPVGRSLQGVSTAEWERLGGRRGGGGAAGGALKVVTRNMTGGWLRKNGVPYSENAVLTEYFDRFTAPNGDEWFTITTVVEDPEYLTQAFVTTTHFKKEPDGSKWRPSPCRS
jgi:hypothetical protein